MYCLLFCPSSGCVSVIQSTGRAELGIDKQPGPLTLLFPSPQQLLTARALEFFPVLLALLIENFKENAC